MQNFDFHQRNNGSRPGGDNLDYYTFDHHTAPVNQDTEVLHRKASRMLFMVTALCILSFTAGLIIGMKYMGNGKRELVDRETLKAVTGIKTRISEMIRKNKGEPASRVFPRKDYPFVIRLGQHLDEKKSQKVADYLITKGYTVIKLPGDEGTSLFLGPYSDVQAAKISLKKIRSYGDIATLVKPQIIKRI